MLILCKPHRGSLDSKLLLIMNAKSPFFWLKEFRKLKQRESPVPSAWLSKATEKLTWVGQLFSASYTGDPQCKCWARPLQLRTLT